MLKKNIISLAISSLIILGSTIPSVYANEEKKEHGEEVEHPAIIFEGHTSAITSVVFAPNSNLVFSSGLDKLVKIWDTKNGKWTKKELKGFPEYISSLAVSPDNKFLATGSGDYRIKIWSIKDINNKTSDFKEIKVLNGHFSNISSLIFTPDNRLISADYNGIINIWNINKGIVLKKIKAHKHQINSISINQNGNILASGGNDKEIKLWDTKTGNLIGVLSGGHTDPIDSIVIDKQGKLLVSSGYQELILWDINSRKLLRKIPVREVSALKLSRKGDTLASGGGIFRKTIKIWSFPSFKHLREIETNDSQISTLDFSKDGNTLVTGGDDGRVRFWNIKDGKELFIDE